MLQLRVTGKLRKLAGIRDSVLSEPIQDTTSLGAWYIHVFQLGRRKALIFMNERTLLSFVLIGARKDNTKNLYKVFLNGLTQFLETIGVNQERIDRIIDGYSECCFTKTTCKNTLGNLNDLVNLYQGFVWHDGGLDHCDLDEIIFKINQMPQRRLDWGFSLDIAMELIENDTAIYQTHTAGCGRTASLIWAI